SGLPLQSLTLDRLDVKSVRVLACDSHQELKCLHFILSKTGKEKKQQQRGWNALLKELSPQLSRLAALTHMSIHSHVGIEAYSNAAQWQLPALERLDMHYVEWPVDAPECPLPARLINAPKLRDLRLPESSAAVLAEWISRNAGL